jgi:hypothetical protein
MANIAFIYTIYKNILFQTKRLPQPPIHNNQQDKMAACAFDWARR